MLSTTSFGNYTLGYPQLCLVFRFRLDYKCSLVVDSWFLSTQNNIDVSLFRCSLLHWKATWPWQCIYWKLFTYWQITAIFFFFIIFGTCQDHWQQNRLFMRARDLNTILKWLLFAYKCTGECVGVASRLAEAKWGCHLCWILILLWFIFIFLWGFWTNSLQGLSVSGDLQVTGSNINSIISSVGLGEEKLLIISR